MRPAAAAVVAVAAAAFVAVVVADVVVVAAAAVVAPLTLLEVKKCLSAKKQFQQPEARSLFSEHDC